MRWHWLIAFTEVWRRPEVEPGNFTKLMKQRANILIVEDETPLAMMMVHLLTRAGFHVEAAWNLDRAIQLAEGTEFDLVTLDLNMPGASGFEISQRLREIPSLKEKPFIFVSGAATPENKQRAFEIGAAAFVEKPFDPRDFLSRILCHLDATVPP